MCSLLNLIICSVTELTTQRLQAYILHVKFYIIALDNMFHAIKFLHDPMLNIKYRPYMSNKILLSVN